MTTTTTDAKARQAARILVAKWCGYTQYDYRNPLERNPELVRPWLPPGKEPSGSDCLDPPDLFAATPEGAGYREQVEERLEQHGWIHLGSVPCGNGGWSAGYSARKDRPSIGMWAETRAEARAWALAAAVEAMAAAEKEGDG